MRNRFLVLEYSDSLPKTYIMKDDDAYKKFSFNNIEKYKDTGESFQIDKDWYAIYTYCIPESWAEVIGSKLALISGTIAITLYLMEHIVTSYNKEAAFITSVVFTSACAVGLLIAIVGIISNNCFNKGTKTWYIKNESKKLQKSDKVK